MSLKGGLSDIEIRNAISSNKLHEYVDKGIITPEKYDELLEIYSITRPDADKKDREKPRKRKKTLYSIVSVVILFVSMLCGLAYLIGQYGKGIAVLYIFLWVWAISYALLN